MTITAQLRSAPEGPGNQSELGRGPGRGWSSPSPEQACVGWEAGASVQHGRPGDATRYLECPGQHPHRDSLHGLPGLETRRRVSAAVSRAEGGHGDGRERKQPRFLEKETLSFLQKYLFFPA